MTDDEPTQDAEGIAGNDDGAARLVAYAETAAAIEDPDLMTAAIVQVRTQHALAVATPLHGLEMDGRVVEEARRTLDGLGRTPIGKALLEAASGDGADPDGRARTAMRAVGICQEEAAMRELGLEYVDSMIEPPSETPRTQATDDGEGDRIPYADEPQTARERCEWPPGALTTDEDDGMVTARIVALARAGMRGEGWHLLREAARATHALEGMRIGRRTEADQWDAAPDMTPQAAGRALAALRHDEAGRIMLEALRNTPHQGDMAAYAMARAAMSGLGDADMPAAEPRRGRGTTALRTGAWLPWMLAATLAGALAVALARPGDRR